MKASLFSLPSIGSRTEIEAGMAGMNPHCYPRMLQALTEQSTLGDARGYDAGRDSGVLRDVIIADSDDEAMALWQDAGQCSGRAWFAPFGVRKGMQDPQTGTLPTAAAGIAQGYAYVGTVDTVLRALEAQQTRQPVDWVFCYAYNSLVPHPVLIPSIETFWTKVMPRFQEPLEVPHGHGARR